MTKFSICRFTYREYDIEIVIEDVVIVKRKTHWRLNFKRCEKNIEMIIPKCNDPLSYLYNFFYNTLERPSNPNVNETVVKAIVAT